MKMKEYVIERDELFKWCSIPVDQLENHPDSKVDLRIFETRQHEKDGDTAAYGGTDEAERNKGGFIQRAAVIERRAGMDNDNHYAGRYSA